MSSIKKVTSIFIVMVIVCAIIFDAYAFINGGTDATISWTIFVWSYQYPAFTFSMGFLMGHLFWQMKPFIKLKNHIGGVND